MKYRKHFILLVIFLYLGAYYYTILIALNALYCCAPSLMS